VVYTRGLRGLFAAALPSSERRPARSPWSPARRPSRWRPRSVPGRSRAPASSSPA